MSTLIASIVISMVFPSVASLKVSLVLVWRELRFS
jgi:hypothetical protein